MFISRSVGLRFAWILINRCLDALCVSSRSWGAAVRSRSSLRKGRSVWCVRRHLRQVELPRNMERGTQPNFIFVDTGRPAVYTFLNKRIALYSFDPNEILEDVTRGGIEVRHIVSESTTSTCSAKNGAERWSCGLCGRMLEGPEP